MPATGTPRKRERHDMFLTAGSTRAKRWKNRLKWAVTLSGAGLLLFSLTYGLDKSDQLASFVCGLVLLLSGFQLFPFRGPGPGVEAILPDLRKDIDEFWRKERRARGLAGAELMPIRLRTAGTSGHLAVEHTGAPVWPSHQYAKDVAALVTDSTLTRAVIHGPPGVGKTTFAIMLTSGVVRGDTHVPLYLSLASWSPGEERFHDWFDRQVAAAYPSLRALHPRNDTLLERLAIDRIVLILDGLDEIRGPVRTDALKKIDEAVDRDQSLIVLTRSSAQLPSLTGGSVLVLERLEAEDAAAYLTVRLLSRVPATARTAVRRLCSALRTGAVPDMAEMLRTPLYLDLLCRAAERDEDVPTRFLDAVERRGADAGKQLLYSTFVDQALRSRLGGSSRRLRRARRWAACIAFEMSRAPAASRTLAWWRIYERVPATVFGAATALAVAPAYRLCLLMPPGLTRGFAIGTVTSFVLGACRGVNTRPAAPVAALASAASVLVVGTWLLDGRQAVVDACEIGAAIGLVFFFKSELCGRWPACAGAVLLTGMASALAVYAANAVLPPGTAPARTPVGVLLAVVTGVAIAALAARLLTRPGGPLRPSTASLHRRESLGLPLRPVFTATCAASAAGLGGAFVGAATQGLQHGLHVGIVFALVLGPAIGLPVGLIAWLNQPGRLPSASALRTYEHDRALAWLCFAGVTTTATATQIALDGLVQSWIDRLGDSSFTAQPVHGLLFGMTIGIVVAAYNTAWPNYVLCITWFAARRLLPWRFIRFLGLLHECEILRQEGPLYSFRAVELQSYLAATHAPARGEGVPGPHSDLPEQNRGTGAPTCGPTLR
ncbi:NACHT domain-containing protein [Streptomyces sp. NPDC019990]|uniref:NACHT domain-containing protein n=1 Tax=Streptomyces sp. NPDC019990 TaxID=3154693 RepID=UPI0033ED74FC